MRLRAPITALVLVAACASQQEATPAIAVSPGANARIMLMDRLRHHGAPRRLLPRVTVEEADDEAGTALTSDADAPEDAEPDAEDAGINQRP
jgi:hypothetical protein